MRAHTHTCLCSRFRGCKCRRALLLAHSHTRVCTRTQPYTSPQDDAAFLSPERVSEDMTPSLLSVTVWPLGSACSVPLQEGSARADLRRDPRSVVPRTADATGKSRVSLLYSQNVCAPALSWDMAIVSQGRDVSGHRGGAHYWSRAGMTPVASLAARSPRSGILLDVQAWQ